MAKKSFLLVSLKENKAKKLAEVISNKTCRKMLDYLADKKDATESAIAKDLKIPISTVHYNMKALLTARLVKSDEYHYSEKGKEVSHYKLANQYVIIAPEGDKHAIREKLKSIIPTALIMGTAAAIIKMFTSNFSMTSAKSADMAVRESSGAMQRAAYDAPQAAPMAMEVAEEASVEMVKTVADDGAWATADIATDEATNAAVEHVPEVVYRTVEVSNAPEIALWFLIGAVVGVGVYLLVDYIVKRIKNR